MDLSNVRDSKKYISTSKNAFTTIRYHDYDTYVSKHVGLSIPASFQCWKFKRSNGTRNNR
ncbi:unnamed protein product [Timema podura]|uniref:Uncharacterized protein n=1 Tax=Timema podura TaxID=61482 RepID=A0ABN7P395_TIMPD|nr:unnamed protein product [Timema podura]